MIFDDYIWSMEVMGKQDLLNMPKPAIDAFLNIFQRKMQIVRGAPVYQLYAAKTGDMRNASGSDSAGNIIISQYINDPPPGLPRGSFQ